jgi:hypothetical protein
MLPEQSRCSRDDLLGGAERAHRVIELHQEALALLRSVALGDVAQEDADVPGRLIAQRECMHLEPAAELVRSRYERD